MKRNVNFGLGLLIAVLLLTPNISFGADSEEEEFNKIAKILEESTHIPEIRAATQALVELKTITPDAKLEVLLRALRRELENPISLRRTSCVKRWYRSAFVAIGNPAIPFLRKYLQDEDERFRQEIAMILGWLKDRKVLPFLMDMAINAERLRIRIGSVRALQEMRDKEAVPFLIDRLLKAEEWQVRRRAAHALREIGDKRAIPALKKALEDEFYQPVWPHLPEDWPEHLRYTYPVRVAAYFALKRMGVKEKGDGSIFLDIESEGR